MSPETKAWREAEIRHIVLRRQYLRAWASHRTDVCTLACMLCRVEEAEKVCTELMPEWMIPIESSEGQHK